MKIGIAVYGAHTLVSDDNRYVPDMIKAAAGIGFDGIDLGYFWGDNRKKEMAEAGKVAGDCGIELPNYICGNNFGNAIVERRIDKEIDMVKRALDEAAYFGCGCLRIFAGGIGLKFADHFNGIADAIAACVGHAEQCGVVMAIEDHGCLCKDSREQLSYIERIASPFLRANCDIGNYLYHAGELPEHAVSAVAGVTGMVHVKDFAVINNSFVSVPVGEGIIDCKKCFRILKDTGYSGYLTLEYECGIGIPRQGIAASMVNMRRFLAES